MPFITSLFLIDAPASALNNSGEAIVGARTQNTSSVKFIRAKDGDYPYATSQAFRYWVRNTLETNPDIVWESSPIYREEKIAYTDANPITYWDDDLMGYMRAPSKKAKKALSSIEDPNLTKITPLEDEKGEPTTVTRVSPFRVSTLVSISPVSITTDFGTMSRQDGDPVPFEHQFYRTTLVGAMSINLGEVGKFTYRRRTGFQNLDQVRRELAEAQGLTHLPHEFAYTLSTNKKAERVSSLLRAIGRLGGGAKQSIHYTDVTPVVAFTAVIRGGNNPFSHIFHHKNGIPVLDITALEQTWQDLTETANGRQAQLLSPLFIGWKPGYLNDELAKLPKDDPQIQISSTRIAYEDVATWVSNNQDVLWS